MIVIKQQKQKRQRVSVVLVGVLVLFCVFRGLTDQMRAGSDFSASTSAWASASAPEEDTTSTSTSALKSTQHTMRAAISELRQIRKSTLVPCTREYVLQNTAPPNPNPNERAFNCAYQTNPLPVAHTCGGVSKYRHPYQWECRLKSRLFSKIMEHSLRDCAFGGVDIGTAAGDWVIALGAFATKSTYAAVEANPKVFQTMYGHVSANSGLPERVFAYNTAAVSWSHHAKQSTRALADESGNWIGPTMCVESTNDSGYMTTVNKKATQTQQQVCSQGEVPIPAITIDAIMTDFDFQNKGKAFFAKVDIEGGEHEALLGGQNTFSSKDTRPCYVYAEIKTGPVHEKAFRLLKDTYGYTDFTDLDSGLSGDESYPPKGALFRDEGNYEFRLPPLELKGCVERVRAATC